MTTEDLFKLVPIATLFSAISGIVSVFFAAMIAEFIRRRNRAEAYASIVFSKRIDAYEKFYNLIVSQEIAGQLFRKEITDDTLARDAVAANIWEVITFCDKQGFYIDDDIGAAACALNMGLEDYPAMSDKDKEAYTEKYFSDRTNLLHIIKQDSGLARSTKIFEAAYEPKINSPFIDRVRELRAEHRKRRQAKLHETA